MAAFAAYTNLNAAQRAEFDIMVAGYKFRAQAASSAGRKAAETKKRGAASGSTATGAA
jgi:hypothetical protein